MSYQPEPGITLPIIAAAAAGLACHFCGLTTRNGIGGTIAIGFWGIIAGFSARALEQGNMKTAAAIFLVGIAITGFVSGCKWLIESRPSNTLMDEYEEEYRDLVVSAPEREGRRG